MNFGALIIGDEILSGRRSDKHLAKLIELLGARGLKLSWARYAGDDFDRLADTLRQTFATGDVVFSFGRFAPQAYSIPPYDTRGPSSRWPTLRVTPKS